MWFECGVLCFFCVASTLGKQVQQTQQVSVMQFLYNNISIAENETVLKVPVIRSGQLDAYVSISCTTEPGSAKAGVDFEERNATSESVILFLPGEQTKNCVVGILDDVHFEPLETFLLKLSNVDSSGPFVPVIGPNRAVIVTIVNNEDTPVIQLERSRYAVTEPSSKDRLTTAVVSVVRGGDNTRTSRVRIHTQDGLATAGIDYHPKSKLVMFEPGDVVRLFEVEILLGAHHHDWHRSFKVVLLADELVNAELGAVSVATVTILDDDSSGSPVFPAPPLVVSLAFYDDVESGVNRNPFPGYPLICVTPCDPKFPSYWIMRHLCNDSGIDISRVSYSWEVAPTAITNGTIEAFKLLTDSVLFARTDSAVLDSIFFRSGYLVRCAVQPIRLNQRLGVPVRSKPVLIGSDNALCHTTALAGLPFGFQSQSFVATLKYLGFHEKSHPNRLHIHIEIPQQDGMLPLISTSPLHNLNLLLVDPIYRKQHMCSNLILPNETEGILGDGFLKDFDSQLNLSQSALTLLPYQYDHNLRGDRTVLLYRHLNLKKCTWTFDAWYHMTELVDLCGGYVLSDSQVQSSYRNYITVRVPLYVSYVFASSISGWTSMEHHTEMEFSFTYNAVLWQTGLEMDRSLGAQVQILRILLGSSGQLIIHFQTKPKFRGMFVLQHHTLPSHRSRLIPPSHLILAFNLTLLWTAKTYDAPTQTWRAVSDYSLKDYTGKYILELVPCTVSPTQVYAATKDSNAALSVCTAHPPERFEIPIAFQQTNRPVPVLYTLNTDFQLMNNERMFLSDPKNIEFSLSDADYKGMFSKGQKVYGRVLWHPEQDLKSAYKLNIEKVYLCTGQDGYVPAYDPTGDDYGEGPQFGCIQPNRKLRHRILILDRSNNHGLHSQGYNSPLINAAFAEDESSYKILQKLTGVDGFVFEVDGLYNVDAGHQWFIQVLYTIGPSDTSSTRWRRALEFGGADLAAKMVPRQNGTNMRVLRLYQSDAENSKDAKQLPTPVATIVSLTIILSIAIIVAGVLFKRYNRNGSCHRKADTNKYSVERCLFQKSEESVKVLSVGGASCVVKIQKVPLACFNVPADATEV